MYIGEQLINPTDERLRLSAQLGCKGIVIDTRPNRDVCNEDGTWDVDRLKAQKARIERFGMKLEGMALDVSSILLDSLRDPPKAEKIAERLRQNIRAAGAAGVPMLKYTVAMVGITRTGYQGVGEGVARVRVRCRERAYRRVGRHVLVDRGR